MKFLNPAEPVNTAPPNVLLEVDSTDVQALLALVADKRSRGLTGPKSVAFYAQLDKALTAANIYQITAREGA